MSTRTERIFAAFQGPVLSVGTAVVHMYRSYTAELLLPRRWRLALGLGTEDVVAALRHATVRAEAAPSSPPLRCAACGDVVVLSGVRELSEGLHGDLESYCATVRSHCTSSSRHLRCSTLVLAVELASTLVCSEQFAVFARRPGRQTRKRTYSSFSVSSPPSATVEHPDAAEDAEAQPLEPPPLWVRRPGAVLPPSAALLVPGIASELTRVPGFLLQKSSATEDSLILVRAFTTAQGAARGCDICTKYARNVIPNAIGCDAGRVSVLVARVGNW
eukprot:m51a1_g12601 hypothetical protein (274) ;mRNA; f:1123-2098